MDRAIAGTRASDLVKQGKAADTVRRPWVAPRTTRRSKALIRVLDVAELPLGAKKVVQAGDTEVLLIHSEEGLVAVQAKCPHAGAPLEKGAVCNGRLVCPWHMGTFDLPGGELVEPPPMAALKTYAVQVDGSGILVDSEPLPPAGAPIRQVEDGIVQAPILLAGVGAAGAMAAITLREQGFGGRIVAVDPVATEPVDRTQLTKQALSGKMPLEKVGLNAFLDLDVERVQGSIVALSAADSTARLSDGQVLHFDSALVATGGRPTRLAVPGAELGHTIRHSDDVREILAASEGKKTAVIVGTSFIGLEAASALTQKGMQVTVVGREGLPFANKFGDEVARAVKSLHERNGTRFRLGVEVVAIGPEGVTVRDEASSHGSDAELVAGELVVMGIGVEPELGFKHDLPLALKGGGIETDTSLRAAGRVWVAGDIANVEGTRIEHWRLAEQHGRVAALAMLGRQVSYQGVPFFWTSHFGKRLGYLGHAQEWDRIVVDGDIGEFNFVAFYLKDRAVKAALSCGRDARTALLAESMRSELTLDEARETIS